MLNQSVLCTIFSRRNNYLSLRYIVYQYNRPLCFIRLIKTFVFNFNNKTSSIRQNIKIQADDLIISTLFLIISVLTLVSDEAVPFLGLYNIY